MVTKSSEDLAVALVQSNYAGGCKLVKNMTVGQRNRFNAIRAQLKADTRNELTEIEYYNLAKRIYFCESIEATMEMDGPENVPKEVLAMYDRTQ